MTDLDAVYGIDQRTLAFENYEGGVLVCLAGPGTGKTFSLLARAQSLAARGNDQDSVCYLTFIREIAGAFIRKMVSSLSTPRLGISMNRRGRRSHGW